MDPTTKTCRNRMMSFGTTIFTRDCARIVVCVLILISTCSQPASLPLCGENEFQGPTKSKARCRKENITARFIKRRTEIS